MPETNTNTRSPGISPTQPATETETYANASAEIVADDDSSVYAETEWSSSDSASIASSVMHYRYENGRRYDSYGQGRYMMPNDEWEQDRLDLVHHIFLLLFKGELFIAPIESPQAILDLGTGTGIWAMDVADNFPSARVIGNDLSPIQPHYFPPNLEFHIGDFEEDWDHPADYFDFIHARTISGCVYDWPRLLQRILHHLKPGGYFEIVEAAFWSWSDDGTLKDDSPYMQYIRDLNEAGEKLGREMNVAHKLKGWLINAGFEAVTEKVYLLPLGPWPKDPRLKEVGKWESIAAPESVEAYGLRLYTQILGWSVEEARNHQERVKKQLRERSLHAYCKVYAVYGRKPSPTPG
ncbi:hypothetical protein VTN77DRAFT_956 [Rasamsonia byssochlamydoides]|uniref:uncharacterized protein n=1 Tax=Rasamsonia byssochlamydoides TaxID=89139 RepID=UPI003742BBC8